MNINKYELESKAQGSIVGVMTGDLLGSPHEGFDIVTPIAENELFVNFNANDPNKAWMQGIIELINYIQNNGGKVTDYLGHLGTGFWEYGETTDDSAQNGLILQSFIENDGYNLDDIAGKLLSWFDHGKARGLGGTTLISLYLLDPLYTEPPASPLESGKIAREISPISIKLAHSDRAFMNTALPANGGTMRAPALGIPKVLRSDLDYLMRVVEEVTNITHAFEECVATSQIVSEMVARFINGETKSQAINNVYNRHSEYFEKSLNSIKSDNGHTGGTLESTGVALKALMDTSSFKESIEFAINSTISVNKWANDTDTYGAITGGMTGALYGYDSIPINWQHLVNPITNEHKAIHPRSASHMKSLGRLAVTV